jgi:3-keto-5-aminohexanoate cleavage enzyme
LTTIATMLGLQIRVGTEDTVWRYPNSDEMFTSNLDMFLHAKQIAQLLGRRVSTAKEYRDDLKTACRYTEHV